MEGGENSSDSEQGQVAGLLHTVINLRVALNVANFVTG